LLRNGGKGNDYEKKNRAKLVARRVDETEESSLDRENILLPRVFPSPAFSHFGKYITCFPMP
jgi:hypothetical protein